MRGAVARSLPAVGARVQHAAAFLHQLGGLCRFTTIPQRQALDAKCTGERHSVIELVEDRGAPLGVRQRLLIVTLLIGKKPEAVQSTCLQSLDHRAIDAFATGGLSRFRRSRLAVRQVQQGNPPLATFHIQTASRPETAERVGKS